MNAYSDDWFNLFLRDFDPAQTRREINFLTRRLPPDSFPRVLDVCCGIGRHGGALAELGYRVTGIDRAAKLIDEASKNHPTARFIAMDVADLRALDGPFEAAICMWQSYGFLDEAGNDRVLRDIANHLIPGGRFVLDIYHRGFFERHLGSRDIEHAGRKVREVKSMAGDRLRVELYYDGQSQPKDVFDWQVYTPDQITDRLARVGLRTLMTCSAFDGALPASAEVPRMQIVSQKDR